MSLSDVLQTDVLKDGILAPEVAEFTLRAADFAQHIDDLFDFAHLAQAVDAAAPLPIDAVPWLVLELDSHHGSTRRLGTWALKNNLKPEKERKMANDDLTNVEMTSIYAASSPIEANRIVLLLEEEGLSAHQQESSVSGIPTDSGHRFLVTCFANVAVKARNVIETAIRDEVISANGSFMER